MDSLRALKRFSTFLLSNLDPRATILVYQARAAKITVIHSSFLTFLLTHTRCIRGLTPLPNVGLGHAQRRRIVTLRRDDMVLPGLCDHFTLYRFLMLKLEMCFCDLLP